MNENRKEFLFLQSIPIVMGLSCIGGIAIGPLRHTGLFWMATGFLGFLLIPLKGGRKITFPIWAWAPYFVFFAMSLFWTRWDLRDNVQILLQILVCPILGIVASYSVPTRSEFTRFNGNFIFNTFLLGLICVYYMVGPGRGGQTADGSLYEGFAERPAACSLISVAAIFLAQLRTKPILAIFMWFVCFGICLISESRMATFVLLALWLLHPTLVSLKWRIVLIGFVFATGLVAFNTPIIQERFFTKKYGYSGQGSIEDVMKGKFDSAGRFDAWPIVFEKSFEKPWTGHGIGESAPFVLRVWAPMDKPHNEYLKMFFEGGYIGLSFFILGLVGTLLNLFWCIRVTKGKNWVASAAFMSWMGFIMMAFVDNPLVYGVNFLHPCFFLVGVANCITANYLERQRLRSDEESDEENLENDNDTFDEEQWEANDEHAIPERGLTPIMLR